MAAPIRQDDLRSLFVTHGVLVAALGSQCIVDIAQRQDARCKGDTFSRQAVGVAAAVPLLMVRLGNFDTHLNEAVARMLRVHGPQCFRAEQRVGTHQFPFLVGQLPRLLQHHVRHADLADIVQGAGAVNVVHKAAVDLRGISVRLTQV